MFAAVAVVALIAAEAVAFPGWVAYLVAILVNSFLPPVLAAGIVYGRGYTRAFFIGALAWFAAAPWVAGISLRPHGSAQLLFLAGVGSRYSKPALFSDPRYYDAIGRVFRLHFCTLWSLAFVGGLLAIGVRWLVHGKSARESQ